MQRTKWWFIISMQRLTVEICSIQPMEEFQWTVQHLTRLPLTPVIVAIYNLVGDTTRTCLASGLWSGIVPNCTGILHTPEMILYPWFAISCAVVDCGGLPDPENGTATAADTTFNSTATFSCNDGYNLVGEETRRCLASGNWSANEPSCKCCFIT